MSKVFTVVIAKQTYLDKMNQFRPYLKPYTDNPEVAYCRWDPDAATLSEAVPELDSVVGRLPQWRAVVICDESGLYRHNPFLAVELNLPKQEENESLEDYLEMVRERKFSAFAQAAKEPLTRLCTWLNPDPTVSAQPLADEPDAENADEIIARKEYLYYNEYLAEIREKERIRYEIRDGSNLRAAFPKEILCIATRTYENLKDEIRISWDSEQLRTYSRFYDWNLYFDKMRYLVFDILPKTSNAFALDCLRFMNAVAIISSNETPADVLQPNTVYRIRCDANEDALRKAICTYDAKMELTADILQGQIRTIQMTERPHFSDTEAQKAFCVSTPISVHVPEDAKLGESLAAVDRPGLATDCPTEEIYAWKTAYQNSRRAFLHFLKQPRRSLKKASEDMRGRAYADLRGAENLNEFQLEDIIDHTRSEELKMIEVDTCSPYDTKKLLENLETANNSVTEEIRMRMRKKQTILIGCTVLVCCVLCFLPLLLSNSTTGKTAAVSLLLLGIFTALAAGISMLLILWQRHLLKKQYGKYNDTVRRLQNRVLDSLKQYAAYLTHTCNVMRGNSVISFRTENGDPDRKEILILRKHISNINDSRAELQSVFGTYLGNKKPDIELTAEDAYQYDFRRPTDYSYPILFSSEQATQIEYFQPGTYAEVPLDFIRRIGAEREELYD